MCLCVCVCVCVGARARACAWGVTFQVDPFPVNTLICVVPLPVERLCMCLHRRGERSGGQKRPGKRYGKSVFIEPLFSQVNTFSMAGDEVLLCTAFHKTAVSQGRKHCY